MRHFRAPWSISLILISCLTSLVLVALSVYAWRDTHLVAPVCLAILFGASLFTIRGYTVLDEVILVHRLLWATRLPRGPIVSVVFDPKLLRSSVKFFGNGGLFSFTGLYWNRQLGRYRAFVTDQSRALILRYPDRTVVLSPESPQAFVSALAPAPRTSESHG